jgi:hypothetical protein
VFAADAADRMVHAARQVQRALAARGNEASLGSSVTPLAAFGGVDTITARRRIADAVIAAGKHPF